MKIVELKNITHTFQKERCTSESEKNYDTNLVLVRKSKMCTVFDTIGAYKHFHLLHANVTANYNI